MRRNVLAVSVLAGLILVGCKNDKLEHLQVPADETVTMQSIIQSGDYAILSEWYTNTNPLTDHGDGSYTLSFLSEPEQGYARFRRQDGGHVDLTEFVNGSLIVDVSVANWGDAGAANAYVKIFMGSETVPADAPIEISDTELASLDTWYRCTLPINLMTTYDELAGTDDNGLSPWDLLSFGAHYSNMNNMSYSFKNITFNKESPADTSGVSCVESGDESSVPSIVVGIPSIPSDGVSMAQLLTGGYYTNFTADWGNNNSSVGNLTTGQINVDFTGETSNAVARFDSRSSNFDFAGYGNGSLFIDLTVNSYGTNNDGSPYDDKYTPYVKIFIKDDSSPGFVEIHDIDPSNPDSVNWDERVAVGTKNRCIIPLNKITSESQLTDADGDGSNLAPWDFISFGGNFGNLNAMNYQVENIYFSPSEPSKVGGNNSGIKCHR
ncbi:hypothetical protein [Vibrio cincinnatiensis]|uniref:hypothetical protein n=1 Tax=Vibrio cincinnatiensis TaxID=675 RepID=UPI001FAA5762|nr:hypothetical protein [Vibrio cincinnatiensis]